MGRKIVIHGGWNGSEVFDDTWILNTESFVWIQPKTTGFAPSGRYGHTMTLTGDGRLIVIGGASIVKETGFPKFHDDTRQLDTDNMIWIRPRLNGHIPTGRYGHSATLAFDGNIVIFGGWGKAGCQNREQINDLKAYSTQVLDTKSMTWFVPKKLGHKQFKHTYNHSACKSDSSTIYMFGGFDGRQSTFDFVILNVESQSNNLN